MGTVLMTAEGKTEGVYVTRSERSLPRANTEAGRGHGLLRWGLSANFLATAAPIRRISKPPVPVISMWVPPGMPAFKLQLAPSHAAAVLRTHLGILRDLSAFYSRIPVSKHSSTSPCRLQDKPSVPPRFLGVTHNHGMDRKAGNVISTGGSLRSERSRLFHRVTLSRIYSSTKLLTISTTSKDRPTKVGSTEFKSHRLKLTLVIH